MCLPLASYVTLSPLGGTPLHKTVKSYPSPLLLANAPVAKPRAKFIEQILYFGFVQFDVH